MRSRRSERKLEESPAPAIEWAPMRELFGDEEPVPAEAARFENACAAMLLKHAHYLHDVEGRRMPLHYARDKDGREVDFVLCEDGAPAALVECKLADAALAPLLPALALRFPQAAAVQIVRDLRQPEQREKVAIEPAARWLAALAA